MHLEFNTMRFTSLIKKLLFGSLAFFFLKFTCGLWHIRKSYPHITRMPESDNHGFIPSSPRRDTAPKTLTPFTIKLLLNTLPTNQTVLVLGWVKTIKNTNTGTIFEIDDGTGKVSCSFFPSGIYEEEMSTLIEKDNFLKVIGTLRSFDNEPSVSVNSVEEITDFSYLNFHLLNVLQQHKYKNRELRRSAQSESKPASKSSNIRDDVLLCYRNNQDDNGLHIDLVINMLSGKYKEDSIREEINHLLDDCFLFSVDGECYKTVE